MQHHIYSSASAEELIKLGKLLMLFSFVRMNLEPKKRRHLSAFHFFLLVWDSLSPRMTLCPGFSGTNWLFDCISIFTRISLHDIITVTAFANLTTISIQQPQKVCLALFFLQFEWNICHQLCSNCYNNRLSSVRSFNN